LDVKKTVGNYSVWNIYSGRNRAHKMEQLFDTSEVPPAHQLAAPTCCAQFRPLYAFYAEELPKVFQRARNQYIKQSFHTITLPAPSTMIGQ
jgi:hypothetical protein